MQCANIAAVDCEMGFTEMLPNITIVLRIFLTMCFSVASCEWSFPKLKLVENLTLLADE